MGQVAIMAEKISKERTAVSVSVDSIWEPH